MLGLNRQNILCRLDIGQATPTAENRQTYLLLGPLMVHLLLKELDGTPTAVTLQATPIAEMVGQALPSAGTTDKRHLLL